MDKNTAKAIVKVFSVLGFIGGALSVIAGLLLAVFGSALAGVLIGAKSPLIGALAGGALIVAAVLMVIAGVIGLVIAWGLLKMKKWARIVEGIGGILSLFGFPVGTIVGIIVIYFFLVNKDIAKVCSN